MRQEMSGCDCLKKAENRHDLEYGSKIRIIFTNTASFRYLHYHTPAAQVRTIAVPRIDTGPSSCG
jgi:hypothetical protein